MSRFKFINYNVTGFKANFTVSSNEGKGPLRCSSCNKFTPDDWDKQKKINCCNNCGTLLFSEENLP